LPCARQRPPPPSLRARWCPPPPQMRAWWRRPPPPTRARRRLSPPLMCARRRPPPGTSRRGAFFSLVAGHFLHLLGNLSAVVDNFTTAVRNFSLVVNNFATTCANDSQLRCNNMLKLKLYTANEKLPIGTLKLLTDVGKLPAAALNCPPIRGSCLGHLQPCDPNGRPF
jgi:hypothetical protein